MSLQNNKLVKIPNNEWHQLRDLYKKDWPKYHIAHNSIENYIKWLEKDPSIKNVDIFSLNGDWSDGTFIILDRYAVLTHTLSDCLDNMVVAMDLLDKSKNYFIFGITERLLPGIEKYFNINKWKFDPKESETIWHYLDRKLIENFEIILPEGIVLKSLTENNSGIINELWPHHHPGSETLVKRLIRYNYSLGAFKENSGELIAWCLRLPLGSLGLLQVKENYKRHGYGSLIVKAMSKFYYDNQEDVSAPVIKTNTASRNMFKNLGFKEFDNVYALLTQASDPNYIWNENDDN